MDLHTRASIRLSGYAVIPGVLNATTVFGLLRRFHLWSYDVQRNGLTDVEKEAANRQHAAPGHEFSFEMNGFAQIVKPYADALLGGAEQDNRQIVGIGPSEFDVPVPWYHLDGGFDTTVVPNENFPAFDLLIGALLTPIPGPEAGGVVVWPGAHVKVQEKFRTEDASEVRTKITTNKYDFGEHEVITGNAGDLILLHSALPHSSDSNLTALPAVRTYIRYRSVQRPPGGIKNQRDIFHGWNI